MLAHAEALAGHDQIALTISEQAMQGGTSHGALRPFCMRARAEVLLLARRFEEAAAIADELLDLARTAGQLGIEAWALRLAGEVRVGQGRSGAARRLLWQSHCLARQQGMQPLIAPIGCVHWPPLPEWTMVQRKRLRRRNRLTYCIAGWR
jgi:hypothetical protein